MNAAINDLDLEMVFSDVFAELKANPTSSSPTRPISSTNLSGFIAMGAASWASLALRIVEEGLAGLTPGGVCSLYRYPILGGADALFELFDPSCNSIAASFMRKSIPTSSARNSKRPFTRGRSHRGGWLDSEERVSVAPTIFRGLQTPGALRTRV